MIVLLLTVVIGNNHKGNAMYSDWIKREQFGKIKDFDERLNYYLEQCARTPQEVYVHNDDEWRVCDKNRCEIIHLDYCPIQRVDLSPFHNIKRIEIGSNYSGELPGWNIETVKELWIQQERTWIELSELDLSQLESLSVRVACYDEPQTLHAPNLQELCIKFASVDTHERNIISLDLSDCANLKGLYLFNPETLDIRSIGYLDDLRVLNIYNGFVPDLSWIAKYENLTDLTVTQSFLRDLKGIEKLVSLRNVDLCGNNLGDATPIMNMPGIKEANLLGNPLINEDIYQSDHINFIITHYDYEFHRKIQRYAEIEFFQRIHRDLMKIDERIIMETNEARREYLEREKNKDLSTRFRERIQSDFAGTVIYDSPLSSSSMFWYEERFKEEYINQMTKLFPFLVITEEMKKQLTKDQKKLCRIPDNKPGTLNCICCENIYRIEIKLSGGTSGANLKVSVEGDINPILDRDIPEIIEKAWYNAEGFPLYHGGVSVNITRKYAYKARDFSEKLLYPILIAIKSAIEQVVIPNTVIMILEFRKTGTIVKEKATTRELRAAAIEGARTAIIYGTPRSYKKEDQLSEFNMKYIFVKELKDIIS